MSEKDAEPLLPRVTKDDAITADLEKLLDLDDRELIEWLNATNPLLIGEIKRRAYNAVHRSDNASSVELLALFVENALLPIRALRAAIVRQRQVQDHSYDSRETAPLPSDDAGDADPQPSA